MSPLEAVWERRGAAGQAGALALRPLSGLFGLGVGARGLAYRLGVLRARRAPVPVISVGNLAVGGTGKTPMTLWLACELRARGAKPAIVSRGYGGSARGVTVVSRGDGPEVSPASLIHPSAAGFRTWRVATTVNNVRHDAPSLLDPV